MHDLSTIREVQCTAKQNVKRKTKNEIKRGGEDVNGQGDGYLSTNGIILRRKGVRMKCYIGMITKQARVNYITSNSPAYLVVCELSAILSCCFQALFRATFHLVN